MNIFQKIKSKFNQNSKLEDPSSVPDHVLHFFQGQRQIITNIHDPNVIIKEIDPSYCAKIIDLNIQMDNLFYCRNYFNNPDSDGSLAKFAELNMAFESKKKQYHITMEEIGLRYFSEYLSEIKNPFSISVSLITNLAFFYNVEKPLIFL